MLITISFGILSFWRKLNGILYADVLSGKPYAGKPSDMWALGVVLFTMLYGQFPFYDSAPHELFQSKYSVVTLVITVLKEPPRFHI